MALVLLVAYLPACSTYRPVELGQPVALPQGNSDLRVTLRDGRVLELRQASVVGDSLIGRQRRSREVRVAVAVQEVQRVEASGGDTKGTLGAVLVGTILLGAIGMLVIDDALKDAHYFGQSVVRMP